MKAKTINRILTGKIKAWTETIEDEGLKEAVRRGCIVTGGCITSMLINEEVNDFDVYLRDANTTERLANYYVDRFKNEGKHRVALSIVVKREDESKAVKIYIKSAGVLGEDSKNYEYFEDPNAADPEEFLSSIESLASGKDYRPVFLSENAITLSDKIQIVTRFYGEPEEIHENYDFVHCTNYWTSGGLTLNQPALLSILEKSLKYVGSLYPLASVIRTRKFIQRGWTITAGEYLKMLLQLNDLDLRNFSTLKEQLTGVDVAYFEELLSILKERYQADEIVDSTYLAALMDKLL